MELLGGEYGRKDSTNAHWIDFNENLLKDEDERFYMTVTINLSSNTIEVFSEGNSIGKNICNNTYLDKKIISDNEIPFTIGVLVSGDGPVKQYCKFQLYGCRLYGRVLSDDEILQNYEKSKNLLND